MFGIPLRNKRDKEDEPTCVVANYVKIDSTLDKKQSSIAYHFTRYCIRSGIIAQEWIDGEKNDITSVHSCRISFKSYHN